MKNNIISISKKGNLKGEDGTRVISVRIRDDLLKKIDGIAKEAGRSRNELINIILESSIDNIVVE